MASDTAPRMHDADLCVAPASDETAPNMSL